MLANGVLKIFVHQGTYDDLDELEKIVTASGYKAFMHNGDIYVLNESTNKWIETCFQWNDFTTKKD